MVAVCIRERKCSFFIYPHLQPHNPNGHAKKNLYTALYCRGATWQISSNAITLYIWGAESAKCIISLLPYFLQLFYIAGGELCMVLPCPTRMKNAFAWWYGCPCMVCFHPVYRRGLAWCTFWSPTCRGRPTHDVIRRSRSCLINFLSSSRWPTLQ
jgi:hypothetical protein